jgi:hypothetical protein
MASSSHHLSICLVIGATLLVAGCDKAEPISYQIPKESREASPPIPVAAEKQAEAPGGMNVMAGMQEAADAAGDLTYTVPQNWTELPASGIRKANFRIEDQNGTAELTVTVFPGDVGGRLANVNRWREQIGLDPAAPEDLSTLSEPYAISRHRGEIVKLEGGMNSILGGLLPFHGNTWFFKLQGSSTTVLNAEPQFKEFLDSVVIPDNHH